MGPTSGPCIPDLPGWLEVAEQRGCADRCRGDLTPLGQDSRRVKLEVQSLSGGHCGPRGREWVGRLLVKDGGESSSNLDDSLGVVEIAKGRSRTLVANGARSASGLAKG